MTKDYEQPDELDQQQRQQQQSTLPLVYLPIELAEEISSYFDKQAATKLLRVSRSFHNLFFPRVWVNMRTFIDIKGDEVKRQMLLEKYGHFVRIIDFNNYTIHRITFDWLPFVKYATYLKASADNGTTTGNAEMLMKLINQSKMLRTLNLSFEKYDTHVKFDELAAAINGLELLEGITCEFTTDYGPRGGGDEWKQAAGFIDLLHPSKRSNLQLKMYFNTALNEVDVRALAQYIVKLKAHGRFTCTADLAHEFFGVTDNDGQQLVFPQLKELEILSCCFNRENSGIKNITASQLPQLQSLRFNIYSCDLLGHVDPSIRKHKTYNWKPEYSRYAHVIIPSQRWQYLTVLTIGIVSSSILMNIIDLNPLLQQLRVGSVTSTVPIKNDASRYNHDEFQLDAILDRLPHLVMFWIGQLNSRIIVDPAATPTKRRYDMKIRISCQISVTPSATVYLMQIPRLAELVFNECVFVDTDETIQLLQSSTAMCEARRLNWNPIEWNQDLALAIAEKMPRRNQFISLRCPMEFRAIIWSECRLGH
ncbi:hypothetical protein GQ42DRAFT_160789 [Ramicandelaber brevisporus]|nr:hypothetical protein GQ42DRAFT_160789 [Ramicandelaber brevisporus]